MNTNRFLLSAVIAATCMALTGVMSRAADESTLTSDNDSKTTQNQLPSSWEESVVPNIAGIWLMQSPANAGRKRCEIRRKIDGVGDYECKLLDPPTKMTFLVKWVPDAGEFRGTMPEIPEITGTITISLKPDEKVTELRFDVTLDDEAKKSFDVLKSNLASQGVPPSTLDSAFEEELHTHWTRKNDDDADKIPAKKPGKTYDPAESDSVTQPSEKSPTPKNGPGATDRKNVLLNFSATWAGPCQQMRPIVSKLERLGFPIRTVDIDKETDLARQYKIEEVPCFVLVEDGRETARLKGKVGEDQLRGLMAKLKKQNSGEVGEDAAPNSAAADNVRGKAVGTLNPTGSKPRQTNRLEGGDVLLVETKDGLAGYSKSLGKWDRVVVGLPKDGKSRLQKSTVSLNFISVLIDDQLFGFSARSGRWSKLKIPEQFAGKALPTHGQNLLSVEIGDEIFVMSPTRNEWTSSNEKEPSATEIKGNFDIRIAEQKLGRSLDRPESRRMMSEIAKQEARAGAIASQIRDRSKTRQEGESEPKETTTLRKELESTLQQAFDLKSELEHLRIQELQSRLAQLEQQVGRRQALRSQIVSRRARELIDGEDTRWDDNPLANSPVGVSDPVPGRLPEAKATAGAPEATDPFRQANETQIKFGTSGLILPFVPAIAFDGAVNSLPARWQFERGEKEIRHYHLNLVWTGPVAVTRLLTLEIYPAQAVTEAYLNHNAVFFNFTNSDLGLAGSKLAITKVVYLQNSRFQEMAGSQVGMVDSTSLEPGVDPLVEAQKRGTVMAVLHLAPMTDVPADWSDVKNPGGTGASVKPGSSDVVEDKTGDRAAKRDDGSVTNFHIGDLPGGSAGQPPLPSYKDLARSLMQGVAEQEAANAQWAHTEKLWQNKAISQEQFEYAKRGKDIAARKYQILEEDYRATIRDIELQLKGALAELDAADQEFERFSRLSETGTVTKKAVRDAKLRLDQAKVAADRLKSREDLYKKAGEWLTDHGKQEQQKP